MLVTIFYMSNIVFFLPFQALSSMLFANIFKLKESKMLLFGKEISSKYSQCRRYHVSPPPTSKNINIVIQWKNGVTDTGNDM